MRLRHVHGQAAVEYLALVGLVAGVLLVAGLLGGGRAIAGVTLRQVARALCVVSRGDCDHGRGPCTVRSRRTGDDLHVNAALLRLGAGHAVLREERSDGTVALTLVDTRESGADAGVGGDLSLALGSHALVLGGEARAAVLARSGRGTTYVVGGAHEADALLRLLARPKVDPYLMTPAIRAYYRRLEAIAHPSAVARYREGGARQEGSLAGGAHGLSGYLEVHHATTDGVRENLLTGRRTEYHRRELGGSLGAAVLRTGATAAGQATETFSVTYDRAGRPLDLGFLAGGTLSATLDVPPLARPALALLGGAPRAGRAFALDAHLDLTDPANLAVARDYLATGTAGAALRERLQLAGTVEVRVEQVGGSSLGGSAHAGGGLKIGGGFLHTVSTTHLLSAAVRGPEGIWTARTCA